MRAIVKRQSAPAVGGILLVAGVVGDAGEGVETAVVPCGAVDYVPKYGGGGLVYAVGEGRMVGGW